MNNYTYDTFLIKSKLLSKIDIICNEVEKYNYYYIQNLKDFIVVYIDNNECNLLNNRLLQYLINNMNTWDFDDVKIRKKIYEDFSVFIYNYDMTDKSMYDLLVRLNNII
jgi:hypothetical protein